MKIVTTTLTHASDVDKVRDALLSARGIADEHIVVWTNWNRGAPFDVVSETQRCVTVRWEAFQWTGRFDDALNECLRLSIECGADWSVMLDSDERLVCPDPEAVRSFLAGINPKVQIVCALAADGSYQRERFFRGTIPQRWKFRTHESIDAGAGEQVLIPPELIAWAEIPKTGEQVIAKSERDLEMIDLDLEEFPDECRLWFYRGNTLSHLGRFEEAIEAYRKVADPGGAQGQGEGTAWACYCAARIHLALSERAGRKLAAATTEEEQAIHREEMWRRFYKCLDACGAGVHRETRIAELHWLRAIALHSVGRHDEAVAWAKQAKLHGYGSASYGIRHGFMLPHALRDGPDHVIKMCLNSIAAQDVPKPLILDCNKQDVPNHIMIDTSTPEGRAERDNARYAPAHITITSTALNAAQWASKCIRSVRDQTFAKWHLHYVACDERTADAAHMARYDDHTITVHEPRNKPPLLENLLPIWRALPPDEIIVWLDGDDWLAVDSALARVADAHSRGALVTYGSFMYSDGRQGFAAPASQDPRSGPWVTTHLKSFRAGLVQRVREADWRWNDGRYIDLAIDQAVMLPCLEMAGRERCEFIRETLYVYNQPHSFDANGSPEEQTREREAVSMIRSRRRYDRIGAL